MFVRPSRSYLRGAAVVVATLGLLMFQNCAQNFDLASMGDVTTLGDQLMQPSSFNIENESIFTNQSTMTLNLVSGDAREVLFSYDDKCVPQAGEAWEPMKNQITKTVKHLNNLNRVYVKFRTAPGDLGKAVALETSCVSAMIVHDSIVPTVNFLTKPENAAKGTSAAATFDARDENEIASRICNLTRPGSSVSTRVECDTGFARSDLTTDGAYRLEVSVTDRAENVSSVITDNFFIDNQPPNIAFNGASPAEAAVVKSTGVSFYFAVTDNYIGSAPVLKCSLMKDAATIRGPADCTSNTKQDYSGLVNGNYRINVRATDEAQNVKTMSRNFSVSLDPGGAFSISGVAGASGADTAIDNILGGVLLPKIHWTPSNMATSYSLRILDGSNTVCEKNAILGSETSYAFLAGECFLVNGMNYSVTMTSFKDAIPRVADNTFSFVVDTLAPVITLNQGQIYGDMTLDSSRVNFAAKDAGSGIEALYCTHRVDGTVLDAAACPSSMSFTFEFSANRPGRHKLTVEARDKGKNYSSAEVEWRVDAVDCAVISMMDCPLVMDRFDRPYSNNLVSTREMYPWRLFIDEFGNAPGDLYGGRYTQNYFGLQKGPSFDSGNPYAMVMTGNPSAKNVYLISKPVNLTFNNGSGVVNYARATIKFDFVTAKIEATDGLVLEWCNGTPVDCGVAETGIVTANLNSGSWNELFKFGPNAANSSNGKNMPDAEWASVSKTFDLSGPLRAGVIFRLKYRLTAGFNNPQGDGRPRTGNGLDRGMLVDNFSIIVNKNP